MRFSKILGGAFLVLGVCVATTALGEGLSKEQIELNNEATAAFQEGNYAKAEQLLKASLLLGEFDATYLNLGRTYAMEDKCAEALDAFDKVNAAPRNGILSPDMIKKRMDQYRKDLVNQCSGNVVIRCTPKNMMVSIDGAPAKPCTKEQFMLKPTKHTFVGSVEGKHIEVSQKINALSVNYVDLEILTSVRQVERQLERSNTLKKVGVAGWVLVGSGLALAAAGTGMAVYAYRSNSQLKEETTKSSNSATGSIDNSAKEKWDKGHKKYQIMNSTGIAMAGLGGACFLAGTAMVIYSYASLSNAPSSLVAFLPSVQFGSDSAALGFQISF